MGELKRWGNWKREERKGGRNGKREELKGWGNWKDGGTERMEEQKGGTEGMGELKGGRN